MTAGPAIKRLSRYWLAACASFAVEPVLAKPEVKPGIVLLHGKNGLPDSLLESLGANVAVGYAARRNGVSGIVLLAPGHAPGLKGFAVKVMTDVAIARRLKCKEQADQGSCQPPRCSIGC